MTGLAATCIFVQAIDSPTPGSIPATLPSITGVTAAAPAQAGFVHFFLITHPDGELEYQISIELDEGRIAWSFPDNGVRVVEFVKHGYLISGGKPYKIEHLHGIRPFARDADMAALQKALPMRVAGWGDNAIPYCETRGQGDPFCMSCVDLVVHILYPGSHPLTPALPDDFVAMTGPACTTDDLLLYFADMHNLPDRRAMLAKLDTLALPAPLRANILHIVNGIEDQLPATAAGSDVANAAPRAVARSAKTAIRGLVTRRARRKKI